MSCVPATTHRDAGSLSAPLVSELTLSVGPAAEETVHLLVIELPTDEAERAGSFSLREEIACSAEAGARGASLVLLQSAGRLELYSTERDRVQAFRPVLRRLAAQAQSVPELRRARTIAKSGSVAALHLLRRAAGVESDAPSQQRFIVKLHMASATAAASLSLGPSLASLFRAAANTHRRVRQETSLADPNAAPELRALEHASAERLVEEELLSWQAQEAERQRARRHRAPESARRGSLPNSAAAPRSSQYVNEAPSTVRRRSSYPAQSGAEELALARRG